MVLSLGYYQSRALISFTNIILAYMLYLGVQHLNIKKDRLLIGVAIVSAIGIATIFLQHFNLFLAWNRAEMRGVHGLIGNGNWSGCFIAFTLPVFLYLGEKRKWWYLGLLGIPAISILGSCFAFTAALAGVLFYLYMRYRDVLLKKKIAWVMLFVLLVATIAMIVDPPYLYDGNRFEVWTRIWKWMTWGGHIQWQCKFIQGWGVGSGYLLIPQITAGIQDDVWAQAHNEYIQAFLEFGAIGIIIIFGIILSTFKKYNIKRLVYYACLLALLVNSVGFFAFRINPVGYMAVMFLGLIDKESRCDT